MVAERIVDAAYKVHKALGPGLLEEVYEVCFCHELTKAGFSCKRQVDVPIRYDGIEFDEGLRMDVLVEDLVVCELKAVDEIIPVYMAQVLSYMKLTGKRLGFLINFNVPVIKDGIKRIWSYGKNDFVGWLKINPVYLRKDPTLPPKVMVRFIQTTFRIRGRRTVVWLATSLLDSRKYPADEIARIYASRWRIETLFGYTKINIGAGVLRSRSPEAIRKEIASRLIAVNIVRTIMLEAANEGQVDPLRISFVFTVRALISFAPSLGTEPLGMLAFIYAAMLREIAAHLVPDRPGRNEPRAIRREMHHYPSLKTTRSRWRAAYAA